MGMLADQNKKGKVKITEFSPSRTKQADEPNCDINRMVARARQGAVVNGRSGTPMYIDMTTMLVDYQDCQNRMLAAQAYFDRLPATVRFRFRNNPGEMLDFLSRPENVQECVKLGLLPESAIPSTPPVESPTEGNVAPPPDK